MLEQSLSWYRLYENIHITTSGNKAKLNLSYQASVPMWENVGLKMKKLDQYSCAISILDGDRK